MVAAEAAAAGCPPLVARHSGLEEIARGLEEAYPPDLRRLRASRPATRSTSADKLHDLLALSPARRDASRAPAARACGRAAGRRRELVRWAQASRSAPARTASTVT